MKEERKILKNVSIDDRKRVDWSLPYSKRDHDLHLQYRQAVHVTCSRRRCVCTDYGPIMLIVGSPDDGQEFAVPSPLYDSIVSSMIVLTEAERQLQKPRIVGSIHSTISPFIAPAESDAHLSHNTADKSQTTAPFVRSIIIASEQCSVSAVK